MNYTKATLLLVTGIISVIASIVLGAGSMLYGFLIGYGYTALAGGLGGMLYTYLKQQKAKKEEVV